MGFTAMPMVGYVLYGSRSLKLTLIDNGYHLAGGLFAIRGLGVRGRPMARFAG